VGCETEAIYTVTIHSQCVPFNELITRTTLTFKLHVYEKFLDSAVYIAEFEFP
jgi:hypothetical protein